MLQHHYQYSYLPRLLCGYHLPKGDSQPHVLSSVEYCYFLCAKYFVTYKVPNRRNIPTLKVKRFNLSHFFGFKRKVSPIFQAPMFSIYQNTYKIQCHRRKRVIMFFQNLKASPKIGIDIRNDDDDDDMGYVMT